MPCFVQSSSAHLLSGQAIQRRRCKRWTDAAEIYVGDRIRLCSIPMDGTVKTAITANDREGSSRYIVYVYNFPSSSFLSRSSSQLVNYLFFSIDLFLPAIMNFAISVFLALVASSAAAYKQPVGDRAKTARVHSMRSVLQRLFQRRWPRCIMSDSEMRNQSAISSQ